MTGNTGKGKGKGQKKEEWKQGHWAFAKKWDADRMSTSAGREEESEKTSKG